ncbi:hypothetical protein K438DRAFT_2026380 [Mycena galopus ATCC 62051]|nr:hypothetical protein K438DRAFT_2026380 [Mycena galopus ATCC 62051]
MSLDAADVQHAISLIQTAYSSSSPDPSALTSLQSALRTPAAWGLIVPLLAHADANVQFFGAHTAQSKIARGELASLPPTEQIALRDVLVREAGVPRVRVVRRKLYGALVALAVRLVPAGMWDDWEGGWVAGTVRSLAGAGAGSADIHEFLAGAAEDIGAANLLPQPRIQLDESLRAAASLVLQSITAVLSNANSNSNGSDDAALPAALACLVAWLPNKLLPDMDVARLVPPLITLLSSGDKSSSTYKAATAALTELLARPPAGWSDAVLLEPLLVWAVRAFPEYVPPTPTTNPNYALPPLSGDSKRRLRTHARLLISLADAGVEWVAAHLVDGVGVAYSAAAAAATATSSGGEGRPTLPACLLAQTLVRLVLALTATDAGGARVRVSSTSTGSSVSTSGGGAGAGEMHIQLLTRQEAEEEEEADTEGDEGDDNDNAGAPLGFWYLLQEALWEVPAANAYLFPTSGTTPIGPTSPMGFGIDMDDPDDPERFRRGSPWTPAVVRTGSYAFGAPAEASSSASAHAPSPSPSPFAAPSSSPFGHDRDNDEDDDDGARKPSPAEAARTRHAKAAYVALVRVLRWKAVVGRARDTLDRDRVGVYRRDVGDTMVNAYYVLRDDLLVYLVDEAARGGAWAWETIEAPLFLLRCVYEALDFSSTSTATPREEGVTAGGAALARLFGAEVWGRLPQGGADTGNGKDDAEREAVACLRRTALALVDTYAAYFTTRPPDALLTPLAYVLGALRDPDRRICFQAAVALRSLCDANRRALAAQIGAFAEVHAGLGSVPDSEKGKVLQSIASVIQALPPAEAVAPVEAMVGPVLQRLAAAVAVAGAHPEPARATAILQLEILAGVARGLTRTADPMAFDEEEGEAGGGAEGEAVRAAREDPRAGALRAALFDAIAQVAELWSADAEVGQALSELFKAITALPADVTLLSLPAGPLLGVVCRAAGRRLTGVWLVLATILIAQLNPPPLFLTPLKSGPSEEAEACVREAVGALVGAALGVLGAPGGMVENPDIVQEFFACMDRVAQDFTAAFCALPDGAFDALMHCAISALALQERYSLVAACTFLGTLIHRVALFAPISQDLLQQLQAHMIRTHGRAIMRAVLCGFAGAAPRSVTPNLLELLAALVSRWDDRAVAEAEGEMREAGQVGAGRAAGREDKERFVKAVIGSRSVKKTKEAANQFAIVAWGLEGSTFGYSSV